MEKRKIILYKMKMYNYCSITGSFPNSILKNAIIFENKPVSTFTSSVSDVLRTLPDSSIIFAFNIKASSFNSCSNQCYVVSHHFKFTINNCRTCKLGYSVFTRNESLHNVLCIYDNSSTNLNIKVIFTGSKIPLFVPLCFYRIVR